MGSTAIVAAIDKELIRLQKMRATIVKKGKSAKTAPKPGGSAAVKKGTTRQLSPAARARIAEAQRKRWAAVRKEKNRK